MADKWIKNLTKQDAVVLCGFHDKNLRLIRDRFQVSITPRNGDIHVKGKTKAVEETINIFEKMLSMIRSSEEVPKNFVEQAVKRTHSVQHGSDKHFINWARSKGQAQYLKAIDNHDVVCCFGPAGTGKTYLAVKMAVCCLRKERVRRLVFCRPAVEAGEKLGFLPGDLYAKVNPYLRPLYDALNEVLGYDTVKRYLEREIMEVVPLAYMRGRTLSNSFIILDEGQNTTSAQMKMFLTRMGEGSKIIVTGDITQIDLPSSCDSGLIEAKHVLDNVRGLSWVRLTSSDIVRHPLVSRIVDAYKKFDENKTSEEKR